MKLTKGLFIKLINEGVEVSEIINKNLSLISGDESGSNDEVSNKSTTDAHTTLATQGASPYNDRRYFSESNSALEGSNFQFNDEIMKLLKNKLSGNEGIKRVETIISNNGVISYEQIKRFKHDIENEYKGDWVEILNSINSILNNARNGEDIGKEVKSDTGFSNVYRDEHEKEGIIPNADNEKEINL